MYLSIRFFFAAIFCFSSFAGSSQLEVNIPKDFDKFKKGTTFVVMKNTEAETVQEHIKVFKEYWKFNSINFITYDQISDNLAPENLFVSLSGLRVDKNGPSLYFFSMDFWYCEASFFKKLENAKKDKSFNIPKTKLARIELYVSKAAEENTDLIIEGDFDGGGHIRNWGPGFVKNHIQMLQKFLDEKKSRAAAIPLEDIPKMNKLKNQTLYLPEYALHQYSNFNGSGDDSTFFKKEDLLKEYKYNYEILPTDELNELILSDADGIYYFMFIRTGNKRYLVVVDSDSGEWIFSKKSIGFSIGPNDFKLLKTIIDKKPK